jgi:RNAse (barnase) inhibitor barstar
MKDIVLDASGWRTMDDFFNGLFAGLRAPDWHGRSYDALYDSIVVGNINGVEPPYRIVFRGLALTTPEVSEAVREFAADVQSWWGADSTQVLVVIDTAA